MRGVEATRLATRLQVTSKTFVITTVTRIARKILPSLLSVKGETRSNPFSCLDIVFVDSFLIPD